MLFGTIISMNALNDENHNINKLFRTNSSSSNCLIIRHININFLRLNVRDRMVYKVVEFVFLYCSRVSKKCKMPLKNIRMTLNFCKK